MEPKHLRIESLESAQTVRDFVDVELWKQPMEIRVKYPDLEIRSLSLNHILVITMAVASGEERSSGGSFQAHLVYLMIDLQNYERQIEVWMILEF